MKKTKTGMPYFIFDNTVNTETETLVSLILFDPHMAFICC